MSLRVLHVVESFGGGIINFVKHLTNLDCLESSTILYNEREIKISQIQTKFTNKVSFIRWKSAQRTINPYKDILAYFNLIHILRSNKYDIVHLHSSKAGILGQLASVFFRKIKFYYTPNGASFARKDTSQFSRWVFISIEKISNLIGRAKLVCVSQSELDLYLNIGINGIYINNGTKIYPEKIVLDKKKENRIIVVNSGRIANQKNPTLFNEIALMCFNANFPVDFIWMGDGTPENENILNSPNIKITGWLEEQDMINLLNKSSVFLSTSLWEGLSFAILESMNFKLALILTKSVGNIDLVANNYNGFLYETAHEAFKFINTYVNNFELLNNHGINSQILLKDKFDVNLMIESYNKLYKNGI